MQKFQKQGHSQKEAIQSIAPSASLGINLHDNRPSQAIQAKFTSNSSKRASGAQHTESGHLVDNRPIQKKTNRTGLPDNLKNGIENLSCHSLDDVKVHYNSSKPAQLQALAFAQGNQIHVGPGQEKHLPHETWHVVQQKQGRVKANLQMKQGVMVNDDRGLEHEADVMGNRAIQRASVSLNSPGSINHPVQRMCSVIQMVTPLVTDRLNVVGEEHPETQARLNREKLYCTEYSGSSNYWTENGFRSRTYSFWSDFLEDKRPYADPFADRFEHSLLYAESTNFWHYSVPNAPAGFVTYAQDQRNTIPGLLTNGVKTYSNNLRVMINNLENDTDGFELDQQQKARYITLKPDVNALYDQTVTCITMAGSAATANADLVDALDLMWAHIKTVKANFGAVRTSDEVRLTRSDAMHRVAQTRHAEKGVWKVGQNHQQDMTNEAGRNYNLVSRTDFNNDYNTWNP